MLDESQNSGYAKYNGKHTINGVEVTTQSVMVNDYGGSNVIQCKAKEGKITLSGAFSKVVIVFETTYKYDTSPFLLTKDGADIRPTVSPAEVSTGRNYAPQSGGQSYPIVSYTLEVTLDASKTCVYEIGCQSSVSGMRCFASIIFYA